MGESNVPFRRENNARRQALENLVDVTNHIDESVELLKRSFRLFEDLGANPVQMGPVETRTMDNDNTFEVSNAYNGKRKRDTDEDSELYDTAVKRLKETEEKLDITQELLRQYGNLETLIINDYGISISRDIEEIIYELNNESAIFARIDNNVTTDNPVMTKASITSNLISLPQNFVDDILKTNENDSMALLKLMESKNWRDTENHKKETQSACHYSNNHGACKCLGI